MKETIGRNEPCPCGSGKKYKKCCGANEAVSITHVIESEIDDLQKQILQYAAYHYSDELEEEFADFEEHFFIESDQEKQFYELMQAIWYILFEPIKTGETILERFIRTEASKIKRPKLREILRTWTNARTIVGTVCDINQNKLTVEDGLQNEIVEAIVANKPVDFEKGSLVVGVVVPFEANYVFYPAAFDLPDLQPQIVFDYIKERSRDMGYEMPSEFYQDFFVQVLHDLPRIGFDNPVEHLEWSAPVYKEVAEIFQNELESQGESEPVIQTGIILWSMFCQKKQKRIQNPAVYVAALHYLIGMVAPVETEYTQKELAEQYGVSKGSISSAYREITDTLDSEIRELVDMMYQDDDTVTDAPRIVHHTNSSARPMEAERAMHEALAEIQEHDFQSIEEINEFMNQRLGQPASKKVPKTNGQRAQQLIYDAFEAEGMERYKLAKKALDLYPGCVDAYVILAETAASLEEAAKIYEKGTKAGEKELGRAFFKENIGYFWGLIETRPFMRVKAHYAEALYHLGRVEEAAKHYEELLELNPNDNQGVRYILFGVYIDLGDVEKAEELLEQYEEDTAFGLFNKVLLEVFKNGFSTRAGKLLKEAKRENKYVIPFLTGKKRLPDDVPEYYGFGDENEAIVYAEQHIHLWRKINGLREWIK